jgi:hypothetical protein
MGVIGSRRTSRQHNWEAGNTIGVQAPSCTLGAYLTAAAPFEPSTKQAGGVEVLCNLCHRFSVLLLTVLQVDGEGNILRTLGDAKGEKVWGVTSAVEFDGKLFLGSLHSKGVAVLDMNKVAEQQL